MIHEPRDAAEKHYDDVVKQQEYKDKGGSISCGHDFWEQAKKADFGDILLCTRCHQYFAKIKNLPWIVKRHKPWSDLFIKKPSGITYPPKNNHLGDGFVFKGSAWFIPVHVRVTD
jgi:hypothetical protein